VEPTPTKLYRILQETLNQEIPITSIGRKYFNDAAGLEYIKDYGIQENQRHLEMHLTNKYFALAAAAALLKYFEGSQQIAFQRKTLKFKFCSLDGTMTISRSSRVLFYQLIQLYVSLKMQTALATWSCAQTPRARATTRCSAFSTRPRRRWALVCFVVTSSSRRPTSPRSRRVLRRSTVRAISKERKIFFMIVLQNYF